MTDTFINITQIKPTNNDKLFKVYQIQPQINFATIMHVGNMEKLYDIELHTFNIEDKFTCHLVNKIYDLQLLCEELLCPESKIQILSILICTMGNDYPFAHLAINFHVYPIFEEINKNILESKHLESKHLSSKDNIINIIGKYSISLHFNNGKMVYLEENYKYVDKQTMVTDLCEYMLEEEIINLLDNI